MNGSAGSSGTVCRQTWKSRLWTWNWLGIWLLSLSCARVPVKRLEVAPETITQTMDAETRQALDVMADEIKALTQVTSTSNTSNDLYAVGVLVAVMALGAIFLVKVLGKAIDEANDDLKKEIRNGHAP